METNMTIHSPRYCDQGPHAGMMRIEFSGTTYLDPDELERFNRAGLTFEISIPEKE